MPTKRRFILFLIILAIMLLLKRAVGQESSMGWHPETYSSLYEYAQGAMISGVFWGIILGICRVMGRSFASQRHGYFTGDLVLLELYQ